MLSEKIYSFVSEAVERDAFGVVDFKGEERLSGLYRFDITLISEKEDIDLGSVVQSPARFIIHRSEGDDVIFSGILSNFEQLQQINEYTVYRATLVPKLWFLTLIHHNQVFLNMDLKEILEAVLKDGGLNSLDYEFRLKGEYPKLEYVCQYGETHFNFMSRWCEREGIYYFFEHSEEGEKVIFTDTHISHIESPHGGTLTYSPPSGLGHEHREEIIQSFVCRCNTMPKKVFLKDYNYRKPSLELSASAIVDERGRGEVYLYGEHFRTPEEGNRLAKIRAEEILCRKEEFFGDSTVPFIQPGFRFKLQRHYREDFNRQYLTIEVIHEGSQTGYLISGISEALSDRERRVYYQNQFTAIPASVQFRPKRQAQKPKIVGTINAKIDAAGSGKYAELDDQGRYKVILPFDLSGRKDGKASTWLRMLQPYAGPDHGMHFPLHKGTEVLLSFIDGDPDRPIIVGAVPNPENPSQVTSEDQTMCKITTSGGNKIHMEDQEGKQRILLYSPFGDTYLRLGSPNDPEKKEHGGAWGYKVYSKKGGEIILFGGKNEVIMGEETITVGGGHIKTILGIASDIFAGFAGHVYLLARGSYHKLKWDLGLEEVKIGDETIKIEGSRLKITGGNITVEGKNTKITGGEVKVTGQGTVVKGKDIEVRGDHTQVTGDNTTIIGNQTKISGGNTKVYGKQTEVSGGTTTVNGNQTTISGGNTTVRSENVTIDGHEINISATNERISGAVVIM